MEIISVSRNQDSTEKLWGFSIDSPMVGLYPNNPYLLKIAGWILGRSSLVAKIELWLMTDRNQGTKVVTKTNCQLFRPDVAQNYPHVANAEHSGFFIPVSVVGMPVHAELQLRVLLQDRSIITLCTIHLTRHQKLLCHYQPRLQPLMVTSLGRAGSTWLIHLLAQHPQVMVYRQYPYEDYAAKYWMYNVLKSLSESTNYVDINSANKLFALNTNWSEYNFYQNSHFCDWFERTHIGQVASFCQQSIDNFYEQVWIQQEQTTYSGSGNQVAQNFGQSQLTYFVEKFLPSHLPESSYLPELVHELYPRSREIVIVRDFRDMLCSVRAFTKKADFANFGLAHAKDDEEFMLHFKRMIQTLISHWQNWSKQSYLIRYEDLIRQPLETVTMALDYLNLENTPLIVKNIFEQALNHDTPEMQRHRTSKTVLASIGRWQSDLDESWQLLCQKWLTEELKVFGYLSN